MLCTCNSYTVMCQLYPKSFGKEKRQPPFGDLGYGHHIQRYTSAILRLHSTYAAGCLFGLSPVLEPLVVAAGFGAFPAQCPVDSRVVHVFAAWHRLGRNEIHRHSRRNHVGLVMYRGAGNGPRLYVAYAERAEVMRSRASLTMALGVPIFIRINPSPSGP